jgi:uncharacterized membrane protein
MFKTLKDALLRGLFILLPLMLLWIGIKEIGGVLTSMATPIADLIGGKYFEDLLLPGAVAIILITLASLILGAFAKVPPFAFIGNKIESVILNRVPMYQMLKVICSALVRSDESDVSPALVTDGEGGGDPCYVMEDHGNGLTTVLLPWSPASFAGSIKVVPTSSLRRLNCTIDEYSRSISLMGVGIADCMDEGDTGPAGTQQGGDQ